MSSSEARGQGFSPGTPVSFLPSPVNGFSFPHQITPPRRRSGMSSTSRAVDRGWPQLHQSSHTCDLEKNWHRGSYFARLVPYCLRCQTPGITGSALGLVGPVSVYCDRVR